MVSVVQISSIHQNTAVILHYQTQPSRWGMWLIYCSGNLWSCPMEFIAIPVIQKETMWHTTWNELGQGSLVSPPNIFASLNVNLMGCVWGCNANRWERVSIWGRLVGRSVGLGRSDWAVRWGNRACIYTSNTTMGTSRCIWIYSLSFPMLSVNVDCLTNLNQFVFS